MNSTPAATPRHNILQAVVPWPQVVMYCMGTALFALVFGFTIYDVAHSVEQGVAVVKPGPAQATQVIHDTHYYEVGDINVGGDKIASITMESALTARSPKNRGTVNFGDVLWYTTPVEPGAVCVCSRHAVTCDVSGDRLRITGSGRVTYLCL